MDSGKLRKKDASRYLHRRAAIPDTMITNIGSSRRINKKPEPQSRESGVIKMDDALVEPDTTKPESNESNIVRRIEVPLHLAHSDHSRLHNREL
jgi:hypothetical protein